MIRLAVAPAEALWLALVRRRAGRRRGVGGGGVPQGGEAMADAMTGATLAGRVKRGAALLDEKRPGWAGEIVLDRLAMNSCNCILGQLYDSYFAAPGCDAGRSEIRFSERRLQPRPRRAGLSTRRFAALADLWRAEVRARTTEAPPCST
jgi:hypothetical protein